MDIDASRFRGQVRVAGRAEVVGTDATVEAEPSEAPWFSTDSGVGLSILMIEVPPSGRKEAQLVQ